MQRSASILWIGLVMLILAVSVQSSSAQTGPTGPVMLGDFRNGTESSYPEYLFPFGNKILYIQNNTSDPSKMGLWVSDGTPQGTQFLKENVASFNLDGHTHSPIHLVKDGVAYFNASDSATGTELWKTDGTPEGTALVADLTIGPFDSKPNAMVEAGGRLYFIAQSSTDDLPRRLFRTDGGASGAIKLSDLKIYSEELGVFQDRVYFIGLNEHDVHGLWRTTADGNGVEPFQDITTGHYNWAPTNFYTWGGRLYFSTRCNTSDYCLSSTDGTTVATQIVYNFGSNLNARLFAGTASWLYFVGSAGSPCEIWRSDGTTAGTTMMVDLFTTTGTCPFRMFPVGVDLYFIAGNLEVGENLWRVDGTNGAIDTIAHINHWFSTDDQDGLAVKDGRLYFRVYQSDRETALWRTQGLPANTSLVKSFGHPVETSSIHDLTLWQGQLLFSAPDNLHGQELWTSDGTPDGTQLLIDLETTPAGSEFRGGVFYRDNLYLNLLDTNPNKTLWRSNGTPRGTVSLAQVNAVGLNPFATTSQNGKFPSSTPVELADKMYFLAIDPVYAFQLWRTDGTPAGTQMVKVLTAPNEASGDGLSIAGDGSHIYFALWDVSTQKWKTWRSDGTADGTVEISNSTDYDKISTFGTINGKVIFAHASRDGSGGTTFERTTPDGNLEVFAHLATNMLPKYFTARLFLFFDGAFVFSSDPRASGAPLYRTDGETIEEIRPAGLGSSFSRINDFAILDNRLFFSGTTGSVTGLWSLAAGSDTPELVKTLPALPSCMVALTDRLIFRLAGGANGDQLWVSDGSADGTMPVCPDCVFTLGNSVAAWQGQMYFSAADADHGNELWVSDGTPQGTHLVMDINPGPASSNPNHMLADNKQLVFAADDGRHGSEPWVMVMDENHTVFIPMIR